MRASRTRSQARTIPRLDTTKEQRPAVIRIAAASRTRRGYLLFASTEPQGRPTLNSTLIVDSLWKWGQRLLPQPTGTVASLVRFSAMGDGDDARKSRRYVVAFAFLIALSAQAKAQPLIDDQTPCSVAVRAFDSQDKEKIREAEAFIHFRKAKSAAHNSKTEK